jgi:hypothetical protein
MKDSNYYLFELLEVVALVAFPIAILVLST